MHADENDRLERRQLSVFCVFYVAAVKRWWSDVIYMVEISAESAEWTDAIRGLGRRLHILRHQHVRRCRLPENRMDGGQLDAVLSAKRKD